MFLFRLLGHVIADHGVEQASPNRPKPKDQISHNPHGVGDPPCDKIEVSTIVPAYTGDVLRIEALDIEHSEEDMTKTSSHDDDTIDEELLLGVVFEALADHCMESQVSEKRIKGE